jgi:hypothetical protein
MKPEKNPQDPPDEGPNQSGQNEEASFQDTGAGGGKRKRKAKLGTQVFRDERGNLIIYFLDKRRCPVARICVAAEPLRKVRWSYDKRGRRIDASS